MKISELIDILGERLESYGDVEVFVDPMNGSSMLLRIDEVDMCSEDSGLIIWTGESINMEVEE